MTDLSGVGAVLSVPSMDEMSDTSPDKTPPLGIDWVRAVAGALAAVSTTVLLSTLGAAGTLLGAALGSIAATIATALYSQGLDRSRNRVRELSVLKPGSIPVKRAVTDPEEGRAGWLDRLRQIGWRRLLVPALALFLVVIAAVTVFELLAGRTLASTVGGGSSGGTTISHVTRSGGGSQSPTPPTGGATPTGAPDTGTSTPTPSGTPSEEPSDAPSGEPTSTSSPSVQTTPSETPEPTFGSSPSVPATPDGQADPSDG